MPKLGVNVDHVATLRQARMGTYPDPVEAAELCEKGGAEGIVVHLREDRRHINEDDVRRLRKTVTTRLNLEMSINKEIVGIATSVKPDQATLVPERRQELTTEGGLDVVHRFRLIRQTVETLASQKISVSLFVDPNKEQILKANETGAEMIELHTGNYADAKTKTQQDREFSKIKKMAQYAAELGLVVNAGHGLNYENTRRIAGIPEIKEINTGHSIVARSVFVGMETAVREMLSLCQG